MPFRIENTLVGGRVYPRPFIGRVDHTHQFGVNIAALTTREVDAQGNLKPGVPFRDTGARISGAGQFVFGVVPEPIKVAKSNSNADLTAAGVVQLAVGTIGQVNRALIEDALGSALTADELAAFNDPRSLIRLLG